MAHCAPQQPQSSNLLASVRCINLGTSIAPLQRALSPSAKGGRARRPPRCLCHLFSVPTHPSPSARIPELQSLREWPFCAWAVRRAASVRGAIPQRAAECGTISWEQECAAGLSHIPALPRSATIHLGSAPVVIHPALAPQPTDADVCTATPPAKCRAASPSQGQHQQRRRRQLQQASDRHGPQPRQRQSISPLPDRVAGHGSSREVASSAVAANAAAAAVSPSASAAVDWGSPPTPSSSQRRLFSERDPRVCGGPLIDGSPASPRSDHGRSLSEQLQPHSNSQHQPAAQLQPPHRWPQTGRDSAPPSFPAWAGNAASRLVSNRPEVAVAGEVARRVTVADPGVGDIDVNGQPANNEGAEGVASTGASTRTGGWHPGAEGTPEPSRALPSASGRSGGGGKHSAAGGADGTDTAFLGPLSRGEEHQQRLWRTVRQPYDELEGGSAAGGVKVKAKAAVLLLAAGAPAGESQGRWASAGTAPEAGTAAATAAAASDMHGSGTADVAVSNGHLYSRPPRRQVQQQQRHRQQQQQQQKQKQKQQQHRKQLRQPPGAAGQGLEAPEVVAGAAVATTASADGRAAVARAPHAGMNWTGSPRSSSRGRTAALAVGGVPRGGQRPWRSAFRSPSPSGGTAAGRTYQRQHKARARELQGQQGQPHTAAGQSKGVLPTRPAPTAAAAAAASGRAVAVAAALPTAAAVAASAASVGNATGAAPEVLRGTAQCAEVKPAITGTLGATVADVAAGAYGSSGWGDGIRHGEEDMCGWSDDDSGEPSTSYDTRVAPLAPPLPGWRRRRRRLVQLFPVPRPHRRKRQALARAAAAAAVVTAAGTAAASRSAVGGADAAGRRGRERTSTLPFTVSRTSDIPITLGHSPASIVPRLTPQSPPPSVIAAAAVTAAAAAPLSPLFVMPLEQDQPQLAPGDPDGSAAGHADPWFAATAMAGLVEREHATGGRAPGPGSQHAHAPSPELPPSPLPSPSPLHPADHGRHAYSLRAAPPFVLFAEATPQHRVVVYRHRPAGRWVWQPLLRVTPSGCLRGDLVAVAIPTVPAVPAVPWTDGDMPPIVTASSLGNPGTSGIAAPEPEVGLPAPSVRTVAGAAAGAAAVAPLEFYLAAHPPPGIPPPAANADGDGGGVDGGSASPAPAAAAAAAATAVAALPPRSGDGGVPGGANGASVLKHFATDAERPLLPGGGAAGGVPRAPDAPAPVPTLELTRPGHYLVSASPPVSAHPPGFPGGPPPQEGRGNSSSLNGSSSSSSSRSRSSTSSSSFSLSCGISIDPRAVPSDAAGGSGSSQGAEAGSATAATGGRMSAEWPSSEPQELLAAAAAVAAAERQATRGVVVVPPATAMSPPAAPSGVLLTPMTPLRPPPSAGHSGQEMPCGRPSPPPPPQQQRSYPAVAAQAAAATLKGEEGTAVPGGAAGVGAAGAVAVAGGPRHPTAAPVLQQSVALVVDASSLMGWRGRPWDQAALAVRRLWEASQRVRPGLLVLATSRSLRSLEQEWRDKQAFLPQPDVLLLAMGTQVLYRTPVAAAAAAPPPTGLAPGGAAAIAAAAGGHFGAVPGSGKRRGAAAGGWQFDEQWSEILDESYDPDAARRTVDDVVRQYAGVRIAHPAASARPTRAGCNVTSVADSIIPTRLPAPAATGHATTTLTPAAAVAVKPHASQVCSSAPSFGRPALSYGLDKLQGRHVICLEVHSTLVQQVVQDIEERWRQHQHSNGESRPSSLPAALLSPGSGRRRCGGGGGGQLRFEIQPRGPRGDWSTLYVLPAAGGKAAAMRYAMRRLGFDVGAVVAVGDTDRDAEVMAAAGAAVVTATRPPPALRELLLLRQQQSSCNAAAAAASAPPPPPPELDATHPNGAPSSGPQSQSGSMPVLGATAGGGGGERTPTVQVQAPPVFEVGVDGLNGCAAAGAGGGACGGGPVVVQAGAKGPAGVMEGLGLLGLL